MVFMVMNVTGNAFGCCGGNFNHWGTSVVDIRLIVSPEVIGGVDLIPGRFI